MSETRRSAAERRINFSKIKTAIPIPNLIEVQRRSYERFLQMHTLPQDRDSVGLQGVFKSIFPIQDFRQTCSLEFVEFTIGNWECKCGQLQGIEHLRSTCESCGHRLVAPDAHGGQATCDACGNLTAVEVRECQRPRAARVAERAGELETSAPVVEIHHLAGQVVPRGDVQVAVAVEVGQWGGVRGCLIVSDRDGEGEASASVVEEDAVLTRPVTTVRDGDVEVAVPVEVSQVHTGRHVAIVRDSAGNTIGRGTVRVDVFTERVWLVAGPVAKGLGDPGSIEPAEGHVENGLFWKRYTSNRRSRRGGAVWPSTSAIAGRSCSSMPMPIGSR